MACDSKSQDAGPLVTGLLTLLPLVVGISGQVRTGVRNGPFDDTTTASTLTACCFPRSVSMSDCRASGRARRRKGGSRLPADLSERGVRCWALRVRQTDHPTVVRGIPPVAAAIARSRRTKRETPRRLVESRQRRPVIGGFSMISARGTTTAARLAADDGGRLLIDMNKSFPGPAGKARNHPSASRAYAPPGGASRMSNR